VEDFFNRHAQHRLVDVAQNEETFQRLPEGLQGLVEAVLLGVVKRQLSAARAEIIISHNRQKAK
jgi:hypothetical protein